MSPQSDTLPLISVRKATPRRGRMRGSTILDPIILATVILGIQPASTLLQRNSFFRFSHIHSPRKGAGSSHSMRAHPMSRAGDKLGARRDPSIGSAVSIPFTDIKTLGLDLRISQVLSRPSFSLALYL
jgi:hypothetical protein